MKADYVHKDSKTSTDETISYKITMPLINNEELQRIDNTYNELVDKFIKQFVKEKDMIIAQRIMMNLSKENKQLLEENQELKLQLKGTTHCYDEEEHKRLQEENQELKKQLEVGEEQYTDLVEEKEELKQLYDSTIVENQKLKEKIKKIVEYAYGTDMLVCEYEQLRKIAEVE